MYGEYRVVEGMPAVGRPIAEFLRLNRRTGQFEIDALGASTL